MTHFVNGEGSIIMMSAGRHNHLGNVRYKNEEGNWQDGQHYDQLWEDWIRSDVNFNNALKQNNREVAIGLVLQFRDTLERELSVPGTPSRVAYAGKDLTKRIEGYRLKGENDPKSTEGIRYNLGKTQAAKLK